MDLLGMLTSALGFDATGGLERDPGFDDWYRGHGYHMFGPDREKAWQWYQQRRAIPNRTRPIQSQAVATNDLMSEAMSDYAA
jgi:hypothetical protein